MAHTIRIVPTVILAAAVLLTAGMASAFTRDPAPVFVNELHYDNTGVDQNEAVEIAGRARPISPAGAWSSTNEHESAKALGVFPEQAIDAPCMWFFGDFGVAGPASLIDSLYSTHRRCSAIRTSSDSAVHVVIEFGGADLCGFLPQSA